MKKIQTIASVLIILLGCVHIGFTFFNYFGISFDAVWFLGTGVAIVLAGFLNVVMLRDGGKDTVIWIMGLVTNLFFLLGFWAASYMMRQPQVLIGAILFSITTVFSFRAHDGFKH